MKNLFDNDFFGFLLGFVIILSLSFTVLYFVNTFSSNESTATANVPCLEKSC